MCMRVCVCVMRVYHGVHGDDEEDVHKGQEQVARQHDLGRRDAMCVCVCVCNGVCGSGGDGDRDDVDEDVGTFPPW